MAKPWERYGSAQPGAPAGIPIGLQDPAMPYKADGAALDNAGKRADIRNDAERIALERQRLILAQQAEARAAQAEERAAQAALAAQDAERRQREQKSSPLTALEAQIARVRDLYNKGPGATKGHFGALDYLPTPGNQQFDAAGAALGEIGLSAFRTPGVGSQSDAELRAFVQANRPYASDYDATIEEKLRNLETRLGAARKAQGMTPPPRRAGTTWYGTPRNAPRKPAGGAKFLGFED